MSRIRLAPFLAIAFGAALGFLIWDIPQYFLPLLLLIPVIIWHIDAKANRFLFSIAYFMAASWPVAAATKGFFHHDQAFLGTIMLAISSAAHCLPFLFIKPVTDQNSFRQGSINVILMLVGILPPLGFFAWVHPFYAFGLFDNTFTMLIASVMLVAIAYLVSKSVKSIVVALLLVLTYTQQYPSTHHNPQSHTVIAHSTQLGGPAPSHQSQAQLARLLDIVSQHNLSDSNSESLTVLPENILGIIAPPTIANYSSFLPNLSGQLLVGASLLTEDGLINALVDPYSDLILSARFPMPVGSWRPWDKDGHHKSDLFKTNVIQIADHKILFLFCAEEYMPMIWLSASLLGRPEAIVSVSNTWWAGKDSSVAQRQRLHAALLARMLDLPIYRSVNE